MCGIAGLAGADVGDRPELADAVGGMVQALGHRGPDAHGTWASDGVCLGHSRLTILDLSESGNQPLTAGHLALTYNGEIYNFRELRDRLDGPFRSTGDTEVLLRAYEARGADCLKELVGMFAFGVWDTRRRSLLLARDRLGIKPLYYRRLGDRLAFCSEIGPLVELGPAELEPQALADYLLYGYVPTPHTPWRGIHKLPPAHYLEYRDGEIRLERYWRLEPRVEIEDLGQAREAFEPLLERVVRDHLIADVPVGLFLSSGIDSSMLATFLAGNRSFTLGQHTSHRDEAGPARQLAEHIGLVHREQIAQVPDLTTAVDEIVNVFGEPFGDSAALSVWLISRFTSEDVKVALSGEGGDEIFCGYRWYGSAMRRPSTLQARLGARLAPALTRFARSSYRRATEGIDRYAAFLGVFTQPQLRALRGPWLAGGAASDGAERAEDPIWYYRRHWRDDLPFHQRLQWADLHTYLPDCLLTKVDRASMAFSLEVRPPLLDHRLVEWALTLHERVLYDPEHDRGKRLPRHFLEGRLPEGHLSLPKRGFNLPIARWVRKNPQVLSGALKRLRAAGVIRFPSTLTGFTGLSNEQTWSLLVLDRWLRKHAPSYPG